MLFAGEYYYPSGGMDDFKCYLESMDIGLALGKMQSLRKEGTTCMFEWAHIYDSKDGVTVEICDRDLSDLRLNRYLYDK
jgi:hypothetical protein